MSGVLIEANLNHNRFPDGYRYHALRTRDYMFGEVRNDTLATVEREVYDMQNDPAQDVNIIMTTPASDGWFAVLNRLEACQGAECSDF